MRLPAMSSQHQILIVEDEPLISMILEDFLEELGHRVVASCETVGEARDAVASGGFELAIVDVNLKNESIWPVATMLIERGVPFVLATGGHVDQPPRQFAKVPMMQKPYTIERVASVIDEALASA